MIKDVTNLVYFDDYSDESLPITQCICGQKFGAWEFIISIYDDDITKCPNCGTKLFFRSSIKVFQVIDK